MALVPAASVRTIQLANTATSVDLTNDGSLVAVTMLTAGSAAPIQIYRTEDGTLVTELGQGGFSALGVAFCGDQIYHLVESGDRSSTELHRADLDGGSVTKLGSYGASKRLHSMARDRAGEFIALLSDSAEICDLKRGAELVRFITGAGPGCQFQLAFAEDRPCAYLYGREPGFVVLHDLVTSQDLGRWEAPTPTGAQVAVSPSGKTMAMLGANGVGSFLIDTVTGQRILHELYDESSGGRHFAFSFDSTLLVTLSACATGYRLPDCDMVFNGGKAKTRSTTAAASAYEAPIVAFCTANDDRLVLVPLVDEKEHPEIKGVALR